MNAPTIIEESSAATRVAAQLNWWRRNVMWMSVAVLSKHIGYGVEAIYRMERGHNSKGHLYRPDTVRRYIVACERLAAEKGKPGPCDTE